MRVLITGGAGYIGSHTAKALAQAGFEPVVYDNLSEGYRWAVKWGPLVEASLSYRQGLEHILRQYSIKAVIHFAARAYVGNRFESLGDMFRTMFLARLSSSRPSWTEA
jgi:UDP-glucose 4-epimerase